MDREALKGSGEVKEANVDLMALNREVCNVHLWIMDKLIMFERPQAGLEGESGSISPRLIMIFLPY